LIINLVSVFMANLTPNPSFSVRVRVEIPDSPGMLAQLLGAIAEVGGDLGHISLIEKHRDLLVRDLNIDAFSAEHAEKIVDTIKAQSAFKVLQVFDRTFDLHQGGKISVQSKISLTQQDDLAMAYTPGVGRVCMAIAQTPELVHQLTIKSHTVAIVTDGSAVLGLGNIGPEAALPVMEGKAMLFQEFGGIDAFPVCLDTQDVDEIVATVKRIAPVFGGVNLEDISAPRCFEIEARLRDELTIPIFHDDQHGTAIVSLAALLNALRLVKKAIAQVKIVINGAGAAGIAVARLLRLAGAEHLCLCDSRGILSQQRSDLTPEKQEFAVASQGTLADALVGADVFLGVSVPGVLTPAMVKTMAAEAIVFAMANPVPEIQPELIGSDVAVVATGRSDYPNQINNVLAFPGVFRGALACRARTITPEMCMEAAQAIAALIPSQELRRDYIIPSVFDARVATAVAAAVQQAARQAGIAQV
jgi:malate dehydrogenase (oxaloacetate-decarboxylating)